jgi:hypothetical protein
MSVVSQVRRIDDAGLCLEASFGAQMLLQFLLVWLLHLNSLAVLSRGLSPLETPSYPAGLPVLVVAATVESEALFVLLLPVACLPDNKSRIFGLAVKS